MIENGGINCASLYIKSVCTGVFIFHHRVIVYKLCKLNIGEPGLGATKEKPR